MIRAGIRWVLLITGTTMGAGYASGREIWQFFGHSSGWGIIIFTILFMIAIHTILTISFHMQSEYYYSILEKVAGKKLSVLYDYMILLYLFLITTVMLAGSGATFEGFNLPFWSGLIFIIIILNLIFNRGINQVIIINERIMPFLILGLFFLLILFISQKQIPFSINFDGAAKWTAAFPFAALNILPLVAVLGAVGHKIESKGEIYIASIISSLLLGSISFIYNTSLIHISDQSILLEIPLYSVLAHYPSIFTLGMAILLWLAILTTAGANLFGIITRIRHKIGKSNGQVVFFILLIMLPFSSFGFSKLISIIYPIYGLMNLYLLVQLISYPIFNRNRKIR